MKKFEEHEIFPCTAIALCDEEQEDCRQNALLVRSEEACGEIVEKLVFGWALPDTEDDWRAMCEDASAWEALCDEHHVIVS